MIKLLTFKQMIIINKKNKHLFLRTKVFILSFDAVNAIKLRMYFLLRIKIINSLPV